MMGGKAGIALVRLTGRVTAITILLRQTRISQAPPNHKTQQQSVTHHTTWVEPAMSACSPISFASTFVTVHSHTPTGTSTISSATGISITPS